MSQLCTALWMHTTLPVLELLLDCHESAAQLQASGGMERYEAAVMLAIDAGATRSPGCATRQDLPDPC